MRFLSWLLRAVLFVVALGFALSNTRTTELRFFGFDFVWSAPLVVFLLIFFVAGLVVGLVAVVPTWYRQRREISRLRRQVETAGPAPGPIAQPVPDGPLSADPVGPAGRSGR